MCCCDERSIERDHLALYRYFPTTLGLVRKVVVIAIIALYLLKSGRALLIIIHLLAADGTTTSSVEEPITTVHTQRQPSRNRQQSNRRLPHPAEALRGCKPLRIVVGF